MQLEHKANYYLSIALHLCEQMEISLAVLWPFFDVLFPITCLYLGSPQCGESAWDYVKQRATRIFGTSHTTHEGKSGDEDWLRIY